MEEELSATVRRFADVYGWRWNVIKRVVNAAYNAAYTEEDLRRIYEESKEKAPEELNT